MCPTARSRRDIYNEHVKIEKWCLICLQTSKYCQTRINSWCNKPGLPVYISLVYLFTHAWFTCLHNPSLPVYPGLVYVFTQAWSTCLPRPGIFSRYGDTLENMHCSLISSFKGSQASGLAPSDPPWIEVPVVWVPLIPWSSVKVWITLFFNQTPQN